MNSATGPRVMTYAELAEHLSIKPASAKRLAQRRKWHRVIGNDGVARVHVPQETVSGDVPDDSVAPDLSSRVAHLEGILEGLRGQLEGETRRADAAERDRDSWRQELEAAQRRADEAEAWRRKQAQRSIWSRLFGSDGER